MRYLGAAAASLTAIGAGAGSAVAAEYDTITLSSGESRRLTVGDGETLENLLIDVSADGADVQIRASGDNWTIRNVGVTGQTDVHKDDGFWAVLLCNGNGTIENCYLADGSADEMNKAGIGTPSSHAGHIDVRNCYVANWADNGIYASHTAENGGGTVRVQDSYFHDNNVAHIRLAAHGSVAEGCVVHNTNSVSPIAGGSIHSKGSYTGYGDPEQVIEIRNCDIEVTDDNTNGDCDALNSNDDWHSEMSTIQVYDTEYLGSIHGPYVDFVSGNGDSPDLTPPSGTPMDAEEAASGTQTESSEEEHVITLYDEFDAGATYEVSVSGDIEKSTDDGASIDDNDTIDGSTASGQLSGDKDSYQFTGEITGLSLSTRVTVHLDGEEVDPASLGAEVPDFLTLEGPGKNRQCSYGFTVDGDVWKSSALNATIDDSDTIDGSTVEGSVTGDRDSYAYDGSISNFYSFGPLKIYINGEKIN